MIPMNVLDSVDNLLEIETRIFLAQVGLNVVVQFAPARQLHDDENVISSIQDFVEFDNVGVIDKLEDFDLSFDLG